MAEILGIIAAAVVGFIVHAAVCPLHWGVGAAGLLCFRWWRKWRGEHCDGCTGHEEKKQNRR